MIFPLLEINEKKNNNHNEKKKLGKIVFGLLPNYIVNFFFYSNTVFALHRERELRAVCIAIKYFVL